VFSCDKPIDTSEKLLSRSREDASCVRLNVTAFRAMPVSRASILLASRTSSSKGTNSVSGSPKVRVYNFCGKPMISMPADPPDAFWSERAVGGYAPEAVDPCFAISIPRPFLPVSSIIRRAFPAGHSRGGFRCSPRLQVDGPRHYCSELETRDTGVVLVTERRSCAPCFILDRVPFHPNENPVASIE